MPTFSPCIVNGVSAFSGHGNERQQGTVGEKKHLALSILINGRSSGEEPPLRHLLRWADELQ